MKRYKFLQEEEIYEALNRVRDAFLAAKDGNEVNEIIDGILTQDEKLKIGRRIIVAEYLASGFVIDEIIRALKVGKNTVQHVAKFLERHPEAYNLIEKRNQRVEKEYKSKKYRSIGASSLVFKQKEYTGFKRKDVKRK